MHAGTPSLGLGIRSYAHPRDLLELCPEWGWYACATSLTGARCAGARGDVPDADEFMGFEAVAAEQCAELGFEFEHLFPLGSSANRQAGSSREV